MNRHSELIREIYAACLDDRPWEEVVDATVSTFKTSGAFLFSTFVPVSEGGLAVARGLPLETVYRFLEEVATVDVWLHALLRRHGRLRTGLTYLTHELIEERELKRTRFYADYLRTTGIAQCMGTVLSDGSGVSPPLTPLCLYRPGGAKPFTRADRARLEGLQPHFSNALIIRDRMSSSAHAMATLALEHATIGLLVLARDRKILMANPSAESILTTGRARLVSNGRLCGADPASTMALDELLKSCADCTFKAKSASVLRLCGAPGLGIVVRLAPPPRATPKSRLAAAIAFISEEAAAPSPSAPNLASLYGLTNAEAELMRALATGNTPEDYAQIRSLRISTVRTHLQSAFRKTGTRRQSELVRLAYSVR